MNQLNQKLAERFVNYVKKYRELEAIQSVKIKYSFCAILSEVEKIGMLFLVFCLCKREKEFLIILMLLAITKHYTGGVHFSSVCSCFFSSLAIITMIILCGSHIELLRIQKILIYLSSLLMSYLFAPIQSKNHLIMSQSQKRQIKVKCIVWIIALYILTEVLQIRKGDYVTWTLLLVEIDLLVAKGLEKRRNTKSERENSKQY